MGQLIVLMGPTGAGKSSQGDVLAAALGGTHLSSGKILRDDPTTAGLLTGGALAPAAEVERVVGEALDRVPQDHPVILDGFPRTMSNVEWLENHLAEHSRKLVRVIFLDLDFETSMQRLGLRDRSDDAPEAVEKKWREFAEKTKPVIEHYEQLGLLKHVDGRGTMEEVQQLIRAALA